jgi:hypothetical protein
MTSINILNSFELSNQALMEALLPLHSGMAGKLINEQPGVVVQLHANVIEKDNNETIPEWVCDLSKEANLWGVNLRIASIGPKTWVKRINVFASALLAARTALIAYRHPSDGMGLFRIISDPHSLRSDHSRDDTFLVVAAGPESYEALHAAILAEKRFDPAAWDDDGFNIT